MSENTENLDGEPPRLYSLQDLQRVGHNPPDGLYTLNQLGCMLLYLRLLAADDGLCDECLCMGTGKKPCPHGNFTTDISLAPILVWPEDQVQTDFARYTTSNDDSEYWVTFDKTWNRDQTTRSSSPASSVERPKDFSSRRAMLCSQGFELENRAAMPLPTGTVSGSTAIQTQASSSAATLAAFASPLCAPSVVSCETMIATLSSPLSSLAGSRADTASATGTVGLQQVRMEGSTSTHSADHGSRNAMQPAADSPGPLGLRGSILGDYPHFDTYVPSGKQQQSITISKTVNVFNSSSIGSVSTSGMSSMCGEFMLTPEMFCEQVKDAVVGMQVRV